MNVNVQRTNVFYSEVTVEDFDLHTCSFHNNSYYIKILKHIEQAMAWEVKDGTLNMGSQVRACHEIVNNAVCTHKWRGGIHIIVSWIQLHKIICGLQKCNTDRHVKCMDLKVPDMYRLVIQVIQKLPSEKTYWKFSMAMINVCKWKLTSIWYSVEKTWLLYHKSGQKMDTFCPELSELGHHLPLKIVGF